jgi:hypothetical protein
MPADISTFPAGILPTLGWVHHSFTKWPHFLHNRRNEAADPLVTTFTFTLDKHTLLGSSFDCAGHLQ